MSTDKILKALDTLGYNTPCTVKRLKLAEYITRSSTAYHRNAYGENIDIILTGSRREGIGTTADNDVDQMFVDNSFLCVETEEMAPDTQDNRHVIFLLETQSAPPGYAMLRLFRMNTENAEIPTEILDAVTTHNGISVLRNDKVPLKSLAPVLGSVPKHFTDGGWMKRTYEFNEEKNGPSVSYSLELPFTKTKLCFDDCLAFPCVIPTLVKSWCNRKREYDWPCQSLISKIGTMNGHVVPVGLKGSLDNNYQWRICLTQSEIALLESFNEIQRKVYVVMKGLARHHFKGICQSITSYIMKNVIFWISEEVPIDQFQTKYFGARLHHALHYLWHRILLRQLPSYMIAERNLLEGKVTDVQRQQLIDLMDKMLADGPAVALRIPEIKEEICIQSEDIRTKMAKRRDMFEQLLLAPLAIPPEESALLLPLFQDAKTPYHFLQIYMKRVIPYIRTHNPEGFFTHLIDDDFKIYKFITEYANVNM